MIEKTEFGVLISYEDWEIIQEKLDRTDSSQEVKALKKENANLRRTLNTMNSFLSSAEVEQ